MGCDEALVSVYSSTTRLPQDLQLDSTNTMHPHTIVCIGYILCLCHRIIWPVLLIIHALFEQPQHI